MPTSLSKQIPKIYSHFSLEWIWHYLVLIFIIIPGEEIFGEDLFKKINEKNECQIGDRPIRCIKRKCFYFSGYTVLIIAAFISGLAWGCLYA
ncbi:hypothetical protein ACI2OX_14245 [Bacillus sp. N9]